MKRFHLVLLFSLLSFTQARQSMPEKRVALLIGNANYAGEAKLNNPTNDVQSLHFALKDVGFETTPLYDLPLRNIRAKVGDFVSKISSLKQQGHHVTALFYFSGHGMQDNGENYLFPIGADVHTPADLSHECYQLSRLTDNLSQSRADMQLIMIDACRTNPIAKSWTRDFPNIDPNAGLTTPTLIRRNNETTTTNFSKAQGSLISFAAAPGQKALDGKSGDNSPYVKAFLTTLTQYPTAVLENFFKKVGEYVAQYTQGKQESWNNTNVKGDFYFQKPENKPVIPPDNREEKDYQYALKKDDIDIYEKFLDDYPNSKYKTEISQKLKIKQQAIDNRNGEPQQPNNNQKDLLPYEPEMVYVQGGTFTMGCTSEQQDCYDNEKPAHTVTVSSFQMGKYEVSQKEWVAVMGNNPSYFKGYNLPVESVSWNDVQEYIKKLNQKTGKKYRLPTEEEWEYAARGGNKSEGYKYAGSNTLNSIAWNSDNSGSKTHPVGQKSPNELGIYDMSGNVWEWTASGWSDNYESSRTSKKYVLRGGSWISVNGLCRVALRNYDLPTSRNDLIGFRLAQDF